MNRLVRAELIKFRTVSLWWLFTLATLVSTAVTLIVNIVAARSLLLPLEKYLQLESHGHGGTIDAGFRDHLTSDWQAGHNVVSQAATIYTSGQLIGVLLACLIGIVLVTSEFYQSTATTTFLLTPRRTPVIIAKLITAVGLAALSWLVSTLVSLVAGGLFLHLHGYGLQLGQGSVVRAILLNGAAYLIWALFGVGLGALIRSQLGATVTATVLYLAGAAGASVLFELLNTYVIKSSWILTAQVIVPSIASTVMVSPTKTFTESPAQWVGAAVLIGYGVVFGFLGMRFLRRRDIG